MISPVRCNFCYKKYDLANTETVARYADCTVFKAPCCGRLVDDRPWKSLPDFTRVEDLREPSMDHFGHYLAR